MSLFGPSSSRGANKSLVEFRAGKMTMRGNMVHPDKRKGLVYIHQSSDSLIHFCWKDRQSGNVEDDWIIFPDDCEFVRVPQCTTGRVYLLKFKSSNKKTFFWMQEPKTDKDESFCRKVNEFLNNPPTPGSQGGRTSAGERDLQSLLNSMSQQQLMQLFGSGGMSGLSSLLVPSESTPRGSSRSRSSGATSGSSSQARSASLAAAAAPAASQAPAPSSTAAAPGANSAAPLTTTSTPSLGNLTNLQQILSGIQVPDSVLGIDSAAQGQAAKPSVDLSEGLSTDVLQPILGNPEFMRQLREFLPPLEQPTGDATQLVRDTVHSPQFAQALSVFSVALQSGQLGPLMQQFGLGSEAVEAARKGDMEAFITALQNQDKDKKKDGDDGMALD